MCRMCWSLKISSLDGLINSAASSAYKLVLNCPRWSAMCCNTSIFVATANIRCRGSMAKIKIKGDSGSPCLSPFWWWKGLPGAPLSNTLEDAEPHVMDNISRRRFSFLFNSSWRRTLVFYMFIMNRIGSMCWFCYVYTNGIGMGRGWFYVGSNFLPEETIWTGAGAALFFGGRGFWVTSSGVAAQMTNGLKKRPP